MALAEICGLSDAPFMKANSFSTDDAGIELFKLSGNMEDPFSLAVPPFANVSSCLKVLKL